MQKQSTSQQQQHKALSSVLEAVQQARASAQFYDTSAADPSAALPWQYGPSAPSATPQGLAILLVSKLALPQQKISATFPDEVQTCSEQSDRTWTVATTRREPPWSRCSPEWSAQIDMAWTGNIGTEARSSALRTQVDALPGAQRKPAFRDGYVQRRAHQRALDVCRHVIHACICRLVTCRPSCGVLSCALPHPHPGGDIAFPLGRCGQEYH